MKRTFFLSLIAVAAMVTGNDAQAQQISVVTSGGATSMYTDLNLAIQGAEAGSTVYLSGGGFQVSDNTKITRKLSIIGIGHRPDNDNADGNTNISGNLYFEDGADGSVLMGVFLSGNVYIATGTTAINNFLLRYCNINSVQVQNSNCQGVIVNQNYIRNQSSGGNAPVTFTNNIMHSAGHVTGGTIDHNVIWRCFDYSWYSYYYWYINDSRVTNNIFRDAGTHGPSSSSNNQISNNIDARSGIGEHSTVPEDWDAIFVGPDNGVSPASNFALKGPIGKNAGTDGTDIGIYGGTGFSDKALPPGPRIVSKKVAEQTDADGNLRVEIQVSAQ